MDSSLKQRMVGAVVLIALAVIFLPMLVKGPAPDSGVSDVPLYIPTEPGGAGLPSRDLPLESPGSAPPGGAAGMPSATPDAPSDGPAQGGLFPGAAAGDYVVSFGNYANAADADKVIAALRTAELPAYREATTVAGRQAQRVRVGPFADRAVAESARLRAAHVRDDVDARVVVLDTGTSTKAPAVAEVSQPPTKPAPATPVTAKAPIVPAAKPAEPAKPAATTASAATPAALTAPTPAGSASGTGFAVQVGAFATANDANALRDKLRGAGFNAFTEPVRTDKGNLTRVRVGPAMNRAEADQLKAGVQAKLGIAGIVRPHP